ncbi:MAG: hypothetical protein EA423_06855 [Phycisphaerales bacterium]|nr:MAG: hypothetical protein EA423_06855 [Phycisphaerales bacterium]
MKKNQNTSRRVALSLLGPAALVALCGCVQQPVGASASNQWQDQWHSQVQEDAVVAEREARPAFRGDRISQPDRSARNEFGTGSSSRFLMTSHAVQPVSAQSPEPPMSGATLGMFPERLSPTSAGGAAPMTGREESANVTQVTFSDVGAAFDPVVSRDGSTIVFASTQHRETSDIYLKRFGQNVVTQLTDDESDDAMPAISPDGKRIAFASNRDGFWNIYVMPSTGGRPVQITSDRAHCVHPSWSPDGRQLVYTRLGRVSGRWELWVADLTNSPVSHFIGYGLFPKWSPVAGSGENGADRILFQRARERDERAFGVWTLDYKDGHASNATQIAASSDAALINPTWSPDGRRILFSSIPNDGNWAKNPGARPSSASLYMIDVNGSNLVRLTSGRTVDLMPAWGSDGTVYFSSDRGGAENLWALNITPAVELARQMTGEDGPAVAGVPDND